MKKLTFLTLLCTLLTVPLLYGQTFTPSGVSGTTTFNGPAGSTSIDAGHVGQTRAPIGITHSLDQTIVPGTVTCNAGGIPTENSMIRHFDLPGFFGITQDFAVSAVEFGVEAVSGPVSLTLNIYSTSGPLSTAVPFPGASVTLLGSTPYVVDVADLGTIVSVPLSATIPVGDMMIYELLIDSGAVNSFFPGSNGSGETDPSYIQAASCGLTTPGTFAAIGFPNVHMIMNVVGEEVTLINDTFCSDETPIPFDPPIAISTPAAVSDTGSAGDTGTVGAGLGEYAIGNVTLNIQSDLAADVTITLQSPEGTTLVLSDGNGGATGLDTAANLVFTDASGNDPTAWAGGAPMADYFPEGGSFAATFDGEDINGDWYIIVDDSSGLYHL